MSEETIQLNTPGPSQGQGRRAVRGRSASGPVGGRHTKVGKSRARTLLKSQRLGAVPQGLGNCNGLAFTIPDAWMLGYAGEVGLVQMLVVALAGTGRAS